MKIPDFKLEKTLSERGYDVVVGIDEAGRGPLAGPVVASAVAFKNLNSISNDSFINDVRWDLVRDSKKLSEKQREKAFAFVGENFYVGVGVCDNGTIDRINILEATYLAMKKAVSALIRNIEKEQKSMRYIILVDGNKEIPNLSVEQEAVIGGDKIVKSIAAASIIAKVTRDRIMKEYDKKWPEYGFAKHKGYGTKVHMETLEKCGACDIHRQSFAPVKLYSK